MLIILLIIFSILQIADGLTTIYILRNGGKELNLVLNWLFNKLTVVGGLLLIKLSVIVLIVFAYNLWLTAALCIFYTGVVGWNSYQIFKK